MKALKTIQMAGIAAAAGLLAVAGSASAGDLTFSGRNWTTYDHVFADQYEPDQANQYVAPDANTGVMTARFGYEAGDDTYMTTPIAIGVGDIVRYDYHLSEVSRDLSGPAFGPGPSTWVGDSRTGFQDSAGNWATGRVATYNSRWEQYFEGNNPGYAYAERGLDDHFNVTWKFRSATTATVTLRLEGQTTPYAQFTDTFADIANITQFRVGLWDSEQDVTLSNFTHLALQAGDVDGDGDVDLDDVAAIQTNFRTSVTSRSMGDLDEDGFVDFTDFLEWKANYPFSPGGGSASAATPEPSAWILGLAAGLLTICGRWRVRRTRASSGVRVMMSPNTIKLALIAASLFIPATASANSIGLNFVDIGDAGIQNGTTDALGAAELAGAPGFAQMNWNNLGRWGPTIGPLNDSSGAATGVTATWDSANTWNTGSGTSTPDHKLMHGYLDATGQANWETVPYQFWWNENKPEVYVTGLGDWLTAQGANGYSVVVYIDGDTTGRVGEYWLQAPAGTSDPPTALGGDLTSHVFVRDFGTFAGTYTQAPLSANSVANAADGHYVVFAGVRADRFILRTEEQTVRAPINGMQIVADFSLPLLQPGDVDEDGDVDFDDFVPIRDHFRMTVTSRSMGDLNEDGFVNFEDFGEWKDNYPFPSAGAGANGAVPEPASWILGLASGLLVLGYRQRPRCWGSAGNG